MNKILKGTIAGAAGIALLLGGAGTFALWNTGANVANQTITAGRLTLTANNDGVWKNGTTTITNIGDYRIVPGQTLTFTQTLTVSAIGDGIKANLTHSGLNATGALATYTNETLEVTSTTATVDASTLKFNAGTHTVNVKYTVTFPDVDGTLGQNEQLNLAALTFTLQQTL